MNIAATVLSLGGKVFDFRYWPILLQKSFWGVERKFLEPLMRFARSYVGDHID